MFLAAVAQDILLPEGKDKIPPFSIPYIEMPVEPYFTW